MRALVWLNDALFSGASALPIFSHLRLGLGSKPERCICSKSRGMADSEIKSKKRSATLVVCAAF